MAFKIENRGRKSKPRGRFFGFRAKDEIMASAIRKAASETGVSVARLMNEMVEYCLKDAGYLK